MSNEDDFFVGASLPDPEGRSWRHPSELGRLEPAAATQPSPSWVLTPLLAVGGFALGGVALTLLALSMGFGASIDEGGLMATDVTVDNLDPGVERTSSTIGRVSSTSTTLLATPTPADDEPASLAKTHGTPDPASKLARTGIFTRRGSSDRLASFVVIDDMVLTSAAALGGRDQVWLAADGRWSRVRVEGRDPYTDVALLELIDLDPASTPSLSDERDENEPSTSVAAPVVDEAVSLQPVLASIEDERGDGLGETTDPWTGVVRAVDGPVTTNRRHCWDALITTMPAVSAPPGSAVVNQDGATVGMVIAADTSVAAIIPAATAAAIGDSLRHRGAASASWLGVVATTDVDGVTRLSSVDPEGPAFGLLQVDDVVISVAGERVAGSDHLVHLVRRADVGTVLDVVVRRDGLRAAVPVAVGSIPPLVP